MKSINRLEFSQSSLINTTQHVFIEQNGSKLEPHKPLNCFRVWTSDTDGGQHGSLGKSSGMTPTLLLYK